MAAGQDVFETPRRVMAALLATQAARCQADRWAPFKPAPTCLHRYQGMHGDLTRHMRVPEKLACRMACLLQRNAGRATPPEERTQYLCLPRPGKAGPGNVLPRLWQAPLQAHVAQPLS